MKKAFLFVLLLIIFAVPILAQDGDGGNGAIWTVISFIMTAIATLFGKAWQVVKKKAAKAAVFSKESLDVAMAANDIVQHTNKSMEDGKLDATEIKAFGPKAKHLQLQIEEMGAAFKALFKKDPVG